MRCVLQPAFVALSPYRMLGIHQNHYAFSPNPWFIAAFFSGQAVLQAYWIKQLWSLSKSGYIRIEEAGAQDSGETDVDKEIAAEQAMQVATQYAPIYALGNLCIGTSSASVSVLVRAHART